MWSKENSTDWEGIANILKDVTKIAVNEDEMRPRETLLKGKA